MDSLDCYLTKQNTDALLVSNYNAVSNNTVTNAIDGENAKVPTDYDSKLELDTPVHYAAPREIDPGIEHVAIDSICEDGVKPIVIQPNDSILDSGVEIKPEICDFNSQEQVPTHACHNSNDKITRQGEPGEIGGNTVTVAVKYEDIDEKLIMDVKLKRERSETLSSDLSNFPSPETNELDEAFNSSDKGGVISLKLENEASEIKDCLAEDRAIVGLDTQVQVETEVKKRRKKRSVISSTRRKKSLTNQPLNNSRSQDTFCQLCQKDFVSVQALRFHNRSHDEKKQHVCQICGLRFGSTRSLRFHMRTHINPAESNYPCGVCGKSYTTAQQLEKHVRKHNTKPERLRTCDICGESVPTDKMQQHKYTNHKEFYNCSKCGKRCTSKQDLALHRCYEDEKPIVCQVCGEVFPSDYLLDSHVTLHGGELTHYCHLCGEGFTHWYYLNQHFQNGHPDEKCYECDECEKKFQNKTQLKRHQKKHSKDRPYPCNVCNMRFFGKGILEVHMRKHTKETPFSCDKCDRSFSYVSALTDHMWRFHGGPRSTKA